MRTVILLLIAGNSLPMFGQFSGLSTTTDGSQLYFSSTLRLRGSDSSDAPKIFSHGATFRLVREVDRDNSVPDHQTNYYMLVEPQVSGDGKVVAYTSGQECYQSQSETCVGQYVANVLGSNILGSNLPLGHARLSPDGRYLVTCCVTTGLLPQFKIIDLTTGRSSPLNTLSGPYLAGDGLQAFADGGLLMVTGATANELTILRNTSSGCTPSTQVNLPFPPAQARLNRNGSMILYADDTGRLVAHNIATGQETVLESSSVLSPWISDDGTLALYLKPAESGGQPEVFVQNTDGGNGRLLGNLPEGFNAVTLSGDGQVAYAATSTGRLLRIDVETGATGQLSGPIPLISDLQPCALPNISCTLGTGAVAPGSVAWLLGSAFPAQSETRSVEVNGIKAPVFISSASYLRIQIPWETPVNQRISFVVEGADPQPFESVKTANSAAIVPNPILASYQQSNQTGAPALFHQNFSALVSESQPAADGEILHLYMTGLGPVLPALRTGEPAPVNGPPSRIVNSMSCMANNQALLQQVPVAFAGLAPGLTGVYQVDIRAPIGFSKDDELTCTITDSTGATYSGRASLP